MRRKLGLDSTEIGNIEWPLPRCKLHRSMKSAATARKCCVSNRRTCIRPQSPHLTSSCALLRTSAPLENLIKSTFSLGLSPRKNRQELSSRNFFEKLLREKLLFLTHAILLKATRVECLEFPSYVLGPASHAVLVQFNPTSQRARYPTKAHHGTRRPSKVSNTTRLHD